MSEQRKTSWVVFAFLLFLGIFIGIRMPEAWRSKPSYSIDSIMDIVENNYVDTVNPISMQEHAIEGMLSNLDPHSMYLPPVASQATHEDLQGNFSGIGVQFRMIEDTVTVIMPIQGGPSEEVGILMGDKILSADGVSIAGVGMPTDEVMKLLKGKRGTKVRLEILRPGLSKIMTFDVVRDVIKTYSVDVSYMVNDEIGYIKIGKFTATTGREFRQAMSDLSSQGMQRLILDLRNNGGGLMSGAIEVVEYFLDDDELVVYTEGLHRRKSEYYSAKRGRFFGHPLVVMIDEGSASASEIVSGAIQDNDRGVIVGRRSFGKGLVQEQIDFSNGGSMLLTVARYYTPSGRCIQKPYERGMLDYEEEMMNRYLSGEWMSQDSIKLKDSSVYYTKSGREVYGGGGIMPDVYIPYQADSNVVYYNQLNNKGLILQYAFDYSIAHKAELATFKTWRDFDKNFQISDQMLEELISKAEQNGIQRDNTKMNAYKDKIKTLTKAYIGRNLHDDAWFYPIYHAIDHDFSIALEEIKN